jgi:hypothetical protein
LTKPDVDFPNEEAETYYYVELEQDWFGKTIAEEGIEAEGEVQLDSATARSLLGRGGVLHNNLAVKIGALTRAAELEAQMKYAESKGSGLATALSAGGGTRQRGSWIMESWTSSDRTDFCIYYF